MAAQATANGPTVSLAWKEAASLARNRSPEELASEAAEAEHGRNQTFRDHFERVALLAMYAAALAILGVSMVWIWHMVAPPCWRWLAQEDISHLQSIATTGLLVGIFTNHFKKRLGA